MALKLIRSFILPMSNVVMGMTLPRVLYRATPGDTIAPTPGMPSRHLQGKLLRCVAVTSMDLSGVFLLPRVKHCSCSWETCTCEDNTYYADAHPVNPALAVAHSARRYTFDNQDLK